MRTLLTRFPSIMIVALVAFHQTANGAPRIVGISGEPLPGATLTIAGQQFGDTGPNIVLFDDFEADSTHKRGEWTRGGPIAIDNEGRTGGQSMQYSYGGEGLTLELANDYSEAYISFWVRTKNGSFPGNTDGPYTFSSNSSWKFVWLMDGAGAYRNDGKFDLCLPTHVGANGRFTLAGNDFNHIAVGNDWWSWSSWMRVSIWLRDDRTNAGFFEALSADENYRLLPFGSNAPFEDGVTRKFSKLNLPGWVLGTAFYDDVYVAFGPGAVARVELADSPIYENATNIDILPVINWSSGSIEVDVPLLSTGDGIPYLFVTDSSGNRNAVGFPVCDGCAAPVAPTALVVN